MSKKQERRKEVTAPKSPTYSLDSMSLDMPLDHYQLSPGKLGKDFHNKGKMLLMLKKMDYVNEYDQDQYKTIVKPMIRRFLPEHFQTPRSDPAVIKSEVPNLSNSYAYVFCQPSFGYCYYLKTYVIITLFIAMILFFPDPCVHFMMPYHLKLPYYKHLPPQTIIITNKTSKNPEFYAISKPSSSQKNSKGNVTWPTDKPRKLEDCIYKYFYIIWLLIGLGLYSIIFVIYSCQMIVYYYNFPWYLIESGSLFTYSFILSISSILSLFLDIEPIIASLGVINSMIGMILSCFIFNRHTEGFMPLEFLAKYDPDSNILTQIMTRKQYVTIF